MPVDRPRVVVEVRCPRCGAPVRVVGGPFDVARARCPRCGLVVIARINVVLEYEDVSEEALREFEEWLVRERGLMPDTAKTYARDVERWILEGRWPRGRTAPIEYWRMWRSARGGAR